MTPFFTGVCLHLLSRGSGVARHLEATGTAPVLTLVAATLLSRGCDPLHGSGADQCDKVVVNTGASSGIGRRIALKFADRCSPVTPESRVDGRRSIFARRSYTESLTAGANHDMRLTTATGG